MPVGLGVFQLSSHQRGQSTSPAKKQAACGEPGSVGESHVTSTSSKKHMHRSIKNQSGLELSKANKMSLQQDTAPVWQGCGEMSVVPPAHRIPPAPVPCGFLWLSWTAGKGTEGQIGKGWEGTFLQPWDQASHITPRVCRKSQCCLVFSPSAWGAGRWQSCVHAEHTDCRGRGTVGG